MIYDGKTVIVGMEALVDDPTDSSVDLGVLRVHMEFQNSDANITANNTLSILVRYADNQNVMASFDNIIEHMNTITAIGKLVDEDAVKPDEVYDPLKVNHFVEQEYLCSVICGFLEAHGVKDTLWVIQDHEYAAEWLKEIGVDTAIDVEIKGLDKNSTLFVLKFQRIGAPGTWDRFTVKLSDGTSSTMWAGDLYPMEHRIHMLANGYQEFTSTHGADVNSFFSNLRAQKEAEGTRCAGFCANCPHRVNTVIVRSL